MARVDNLLVVGSLGTGKAMAAELSRLSRRALSRLPAKPKRLGQGTLVYPFDAELARLALRYHRTSSRLLAELYRVRADRLEPLYDQLVDEVAADHRPWAADGDRISVRARNVGRFAAGERQIVGTVKNAVIEGAARRGVGLRLDPEQPDVLITARMQDDDISLSIDLAGTSLSQRGYRQQAGEAPLREHLAAALLMLARWDPRREPLVDPMCGAGTIPIEAALMARAAPRAPLAGESRGLLAGLADAPREPLFADAAPTIVASDVDDEVIAKARANAVAAGVRDQLRLEVRDLFDLRRRDLPDGGLILCNPPYGERLRPADLEGLYRRMGRWYRGMRGFRLGVLAGDGPFVQLFGGRPKRTMQLANGALRVHLYLYE